MDNAMNTAGAHALDEIVSALGLKLTSPTARTVASVPAAGNDSVFETGSRDDTLASLAGSMRARGMEQDAIEAALLVTNAQQCNPPLPDDDVRRIARSISNYAPGTPNDVLRTLNDAGNADRFAKEWGNDVRYVPELKNWLIWKEPHWQLDAVGAVMEMAKQTAFAIYREGDHVNDTDARKKIAQHSKLSLQAPRLNAMLELAKTVPQLVVPIAKLDANPWVLGVANGTIDLRTGKLIPANREDYITKVAPVAFDATAEAPMFMQFISDIMGGNQELVAYLQRVLGYMLTGSIREQRLFFLYGTGANGKSTLLNVCKSILGDELCRQTPVETIIARQNKSGATPELACLNTARAVMTTEIDEGSFLSESLVKQMTGGDPVAARAIYGAPFEFVPQFKLFVAGNHKPTIRGSDEGMWRRIDLIPFVVTIPLERRDPELAAKLRSEGPGILNFAIAGCLQWQEQGLNSPPAVLKAGADYKEEMDIIGQWLEADCKLGPEFTTFGADAYYHYSSWARISGLKPLGLPSFGRKLKERFEAKRVSGGYRYTGFRPMELRDSTIVKAKAMVVVGGGTIEKAKVPGNGAM